MMNVLTLGWVCLIGLFISYLCCFANYYLFTREMRVCQHLSYYGLGISTLCFGALIFQYLLT